ncbi:hypothetical protein X928_01905 [Petrotoga miotherma DSM 10691]|jgi:glycyl-tRNA synthetase alpha subunit|uniref:CRISPR type III-B/RAMP module-associated protein Cmr5 n=2 Tax=Petrotogaceae TaxID=1643949 RepID=A0A2K1PG37_9BACT|nr:hypothetical protein X928_01905 [Petrotoga miotherma DSM 10691]
MKYGQEISKIHNSNIENNLRKALENNLRKALGVLQKDGVYAMFLWLEGKDKEIRTRINELLNNNEIKKYFFDNNSADRFPDDFSEFCKELQNVAEDIDKLFFMKKILERTLTYALYHVKVGKNDKVGENNVAKT